MTQSEQINIIVVGAGYGGLSAAIELTKKGCKVRVFEAAKKLTNQGDIMQIAANATRIMKNWGNTLELVESESSAPRMMKCHSAQGELLVEQEMPHEYEGFPNVYVNRGLTQKRIYDYAVSLGIEFNFNCKITKYFEEESCAGIFVGDTRYTADAVIVGDGVHSRARELITRKGDAAQASGFAIYRSWFSLDHLRGDPLLEEICNSKEDVFLMWIGTNTHSILMTNVKLNFVVIFCIHTDEYTVEESWSFPGKMEDILKVLENWDERLIAAVKRIPKENLIDWKLLWRDPAKTWVSKLGRLALVGDSAHPHLPMSGQGAAQAMEDGATLGAVVDRAGKANIPTALRVYETLRYQRTSLTQRMGWELRHMWHKTDWDLCRKHPELLKIPQPKWLFGGDAEVFAYQNYDAAVRHIIAGEPITLKNIPDGHKHSDWTIEEMMELEKEQANLNNFIVVTS